jgi:hypothetical protein
MEQTKPNQKPKKPKKPGDGQPQSRAKALEYEASTGLL